MDRAEFDFGVSTRYQTTPQSALTDARTRDMYAGGVAEWRDRELSRPPFSPAARHTHGAGQTLCRRLKRGSIPRPRARQKGRHCGKTRYANCA